MESLTKLALTVFGGIITLAIISVIIGRNSKAPQAISAISGGISNVIGAAVSPQSTETNGNNGRNVYSSPEKSPMQTLADFQGAFDSVTALLG